MKHLRKKLFITGGHLAPAVAVIDEIVKRNLPWDIVFVGRRYPIEGSRVGSQEESTLSAKSIRFIPLVTGRLQRSFTLYTILSLCKIPIGLAQAIALCLGEKPDIVVSFGGYIALPVVLASYFFRIPIVTHEQTMTAGLSNRIIASFAEKVCISFPDANHTFPVHKTVYTGPALRQALFGSLNKSPYPVNLKGYPLVYVTGGTVGAVSLNELLFPIIPQLVKHYTVIHQTGRLSLDAATRVKQTVSETDRVRYITKDYFDAGTVGWVLRNASVVVTRAGANIVAELAVFQGKAILIPLPWSGEGEQMKNAQWLERNGEGHILEQHAVTPEQLLQRIDLIVRQKRGLSSHAVVLPRDGTKRLVEEIERVL